MRGLPTLATGLVLAGGILWFLLDAEGSRETIDAEAPVAAAESESSADTARVLEAAPAPERSTTAAVAPMTFGAEPAATDAPPIEAMVLRVVDARTRSPLQGATVRSRDDAWSFEGTTNEAGELVFPVPADARTLPARIESDLHLTWEGVLWVKEEAELGLWRYGSVSGRVLDADTLHPIPDVRVAFYNAACRSCDPALTRSDAAGRYVLRVAPVQDKIHLRAAATDYAVQGLSTTVDTESGTDWTFDLVLDRGTRLTGSVHDMVDGAPLAGVSLGPGRDLAALTPTTDENGRFDARWLPDPQRGTVNLHLRKAGYCQLVAPVPRDRAADPAPLRLAMVRSAVIEGRVVAEDGSGIPQATLFATEDTESDVPDPASPLDTLPNGWRVADEGWMGNARSDADGNFAFEEGLVPWNARRNLVVRADGFVDTGVALPALEPGETVRREIVLSPAPVTATVRGEVTLNGEKLHAVVAWRGPTRDGRAVTFMQPGYTLEVEPGTVTLTVTPADMMDTMSFDAVAEATLELAAGDDVTHDFALEAPVRSIRGRVVWDDGRPAAGLTVLAQSVSGAQAKTDADGGFALEVANLENPYFLSCSSEGSRATAQNVLPGTSGVELVLPVLGTVRVRALDGATGEVLEQPEIAWRSGEADTWDGPLLYTGRGAKFLPDGTVEIRLPSGPASLAVGKQAFGHPLVVETVHVVAGETREHTVTLARVEPVVLVADPPLPPDAFVQLEVADEALGDLAELWRTRRLGPDRIRFDDEGRARIHGLREGRYAIGAEGLVLTPATFVVGSDRRAPIEISWDEAR